MKRIAIIADSHFSERSRWEECVRIHDWIAEDIDRRDVDLVLHSGDLFEAKSTPTERIAVAEWLVKVATQASVVIVRGNHDALGDVEFMSRIRSKHPIIVEEAAGVHVVPGVASVACLAWPRKGAVLASESNATDALRGVLLGFRQELEQHNGLHVLLTHAMVRGSTTSTGQPLVGCDLELGVDDLALANADFVALGHIHKHQAFGNSMVYPGSPRRTAFGEIEPKGYVIVDAIDYRHPEWSFVETPTTPMLLFDATWDVESAALLGLHRLTDIGGTEVRLRYTVGVEHRDAARARAHQYRVEALARGAIVVNVEEVVEASTRARAPEVSQARTLEAKLKAFWASKGEKLEGRESVLLDKVSVLEKEAALDDHISR